MSSSVPLVVDAFGTSRHRFEPTPRRTPAVPPPPPPPPPPLLVRPQPYWSRSRPDWLVMLSERLVPLPFSDVIAHDAFSQGPGPTVWVACLTPVHRIEPMPRLRTVSVI